MDGSGSLMIQAFGEPGLQVWSGVRLGIANHVEVVVVDIDRLNHFAVIECVRHWIADDRSLAAIDRALVVSVVQLGWSDQRIEAARVGVVSDLLLDDSHVVALLLIQEWDAALNRTGSFQRVDDFVIGRWIERDGWTACGGWSQHWHAIVAFVLPELFFLAMLIVRADRNRHAEDAEVRAG